MSDTAAQTSHSKSMTIGEGGTALALTALAFVALIVAAKAYTPEYAFHAYLFTAASAAAVIAIVNRYYERPAALAPLTIDGRPNYNTGPVRFATIAAVFWGAQECHRRSGCERPCAYAGAAKSRRRDPRCKRRWPPHERSPISRTHGARAWADRVSGISMVVVRGQ